MKKLVLLSLLAMLCRPMAAQVVGGSSGIPYVALPYDLDSTVTAASALNNDEILVAIELDHLCRITGTRIARDIPSGCGEMALSMARKMEMELIHYYKFKCPSETFVHFRCIYDD